MPETNQNQSQNSKFRLIEPWPSGISVWIQVLEIGYWVSKIYSGRKMWSHMYMRLGTWNWAPYIKPGASKSYPSMKRGLENSTHKQWGNKETSWKLGWEKIKSPVRNQSPRRIPWVGWRSRFILPEWLGNPCPRNKCKIQTLGLWRKEAHWTPPAYKRHTLLLFLFSTLTLKP